MNTFLGIDFGTSNSTAGLAGAKAPVRMVPLEGRHTSIPTCIFFNMEKQNSLPVHFGREAMAMYREGYDGRLLRALKSVLGSSLAQEGTLIGYKAYRLLDVVTVFLRHLKAKAEGMAGHEIDTLVLGRPVHFVDDDERADREAEGQLRSVAEAVAFRHVEFQYEPVAAAMAYESGLEREELVLIADLGGGTADFSVIRLSPARRGQTDRTGDILANGGVHIGGTDLDRMLSYKGLMPALGLGSRLRGRDLEMPLFPYMTLSTWQKINLLYTPRQRSEIAQLVREAAEPERLERLQHVIENRYGHALLQCVEDAKLALTDRQEALIDASRYGSGLTARVTRKEFNIHIQEQTGGIRRTVEKILHMAGQGNAINTVFFTGGTSLVPSIRQAISGLLPGARVVDGDPVAAVGHGLALDALRRFA